MSKSTITVKQSILIKKDKESVWDFTQNYENRSKWDSSVLSHEIISNLPARIVKLKIRGGTEMTFFYKVDDKPNKTILSAKDIKSPILKSGGGIWEYMEHENSTIWHQSNTLGFKPNLFLAMLLPFYKFIFGYQTKAAMKKAKHLIEGIK